MCGLFGIINGTSISSAFYASAIKDMALAGAVRGTDGFGMFQVDKVKGQTKYWLDKMAGHGIPDLEAPGRFSGFLKDAGGAMLTVGHHRAATVGGVSDAAAQPFDVVRADGTAMLGVHNGTLTRWEEEGANGTKFITDSEWALNKLAEDYDKALSNEISGAYAFINYDSARPEEVVLATSGDRPLAFCFVDDRNIMFIASEAEMLAWVMRRNKIKINKATILECQPMRKYTFNIQNLEGYKSENIVKEYKASTYTSGSGYYSRGRSMGYGPGESYDSKFVKDVEAMVRKAIAVSKNATASVTTPVQLSEEGKKALEEEKEMLVNLNVGYRSEVSFTPELYDPITKVLHGDVLLQDKEGTADVYTGIIRGVSAEAAAEYVRYSTSPGGADVEAVAIGAYNYDLSKGGVEIMIVCANPVMKLKPHTASASSK